MENKVKGFKMLGIAVGIVGTVISIIVTVISINKTDKEK